MVVKVEPYRVKGGSIASKLLYVRNTFGDAAEAALKEYLASRGVDMILEANWYDYELFDAVLQCIADQHFGGDVARLQALGRFSARHALTTTYEVYLTRKDLFDFLNRLGQLHLRFYSVGGLTIVGRGEHSCTIRLAGAPAYADTDIYVAAGFFVGAAEMLGYHQAQCQIRRHTDHVLFDLAWAS